jgi:hypothetical protein
MQNITLGFSAQSSFASSIINCALLIFQKVVQIVKLFYKQSTVVSFQNAFSRTKTSFLMMIEFFLFYFSGYGSQAVSSTTLSSDDSMSLRSISVDDTPDTEVPKSNACIDNYNNQVILLHLHILTFLFTFTFT